VNSFQNIPTVTSQKINPVLGEQANCSHYVDGL